MINRRFIIYVAVGLTAYLAEIGSLYCLKELLKLSDLASVAISFWIGFVIAFILQKLVTFKNKDKAPRVIGKQLIIYSILAGWNYIFTLGLVALFSHAVSVFIVRTVAIGIITLWNYVIYRRFIFKDTETPVHRHAGRPKKKLLTRSERIRQQFRSFKSPYVIISSVILLITTVWWSTLGALSQATNADQLVNSYLFQNMQTFQAASFPNAHTFLIKWPLFIIERLFGHSGSVLVILTVLVSTVTVVGLAYILYRIDRRPKVIGTAFLALACVLLLIPAQPYGGGLLPVNFAMLTTRNIEYLFYILGLVLLIRAPRLRNWQLYGAVVLLSLLFASDKLFVWLSLGGAGIMTLTYLIARRKVMMKLGFRWLAVTLASFLVATVLLWLINATGLTHITGDSNPYGFVLSLKQIGLGCVFAFMNLLTNSGANPAFDIGVVKDIPKVFVGRLISPIIVPFVINLAVFAGGIAISIRLIGRTVRKPKSTKRHKKQLETSTATNLSIALIVSSIAAVGIFVGTSHYYPVDSRYETISLFALFVAILTYVRTRTLSAFPVKRVAVVALIAICIGSGWAFISYQQQSKALDTINDRNQKIADVMQNHKTDVLVGDYWRVVPINQINKGSSNSIVPLDNCTSPRTVLTSNTSQTDFQHHSFTYLLSLDKSLTDYPSCSIDQVIQAYGRPNASTVIAGTNDNPDELLLFYDSGANEKKDLNSPSKTTTILPTTTQQAKPVSDCADGVTVMNIVAHEDDDILFMNPDILHAIDGKQCVRSVYVTAGDAGQNSQYWLGRERAAEAAYASMLGLDPQSAIWIQKTVKLGDHEFVNVASPKGYKQISLIFMRLPDGNITGKGYSVSGFESLARLLSNKTSMVHSVDGQSYYSSTDLTQSLTELMNLYAPTLINTQASTDVGHTYHDHSDHVSVGQYVDRAYPAYMYENTVPLQHYIGYPIRELPENVTGEDLIRKTNTFLAYSLFDGDVCTSQVLCDQTPTYNAYLHRQYAQ